MIADGCGRAIAVRAVPGQGRQHEPPYAVLRRVSDLSIPHCRPAALGEPLVRLYEHGRWEFTGADRADGFSVVLFAPHGRRYRHPPPETVEGVRRMEGVSSVQITFQEARDPLHHAMPPGVPRGDRERAHVGSEAGGAGVVAGSYYRRDVILTIACGRLC